MPKGPIIYNREITVRVPEDLLRGLDKIARENGTTVSALSRIALEQLMDTVRPEAK